MSEDIIAAITPCQVTLSDEDENEVEYKGWTITCTNKKKINITLPVSSPYNITPVLIETHLDLDFLVDARILGIFHTPAFRTKISEETVPVWARIAVYTSKATVEFIGMKTDDTTQEVSYYTDSLNTFYR